MDTPEPPIRALIVEDDERLARFTRESLEEHGVSVTHAADGEAGLREARCGGHDVIILDLMLPRLSGLDVCQALREGSDVPVLMVTALAEEADRVMARRNVREVSCRYGFAVPGHRAVARRGPAQIDHPEASLLGVNEQVCGTLIVMNDLRLVETRKRVGELPRETERARQRQREGRGQRGLQPLASVVLENDGRTRAVGDEGERAQDAGEMQRVEQLVLSAEAGELIRVGGLAIEQLQQHRLLVCQAPCAAEPRASRRAQPFEPLVTQEHAFPRTHCTRRIEPRARNTPRYGRYRGPLLPISALLPEPDQGPPFQASLIFEFVR